MKKNIASFIARHKILLFLFVLMIHVFFRFYELEERLQFTWDQVDNAWHAKNLFVDGVYPLLGMQAKLNSGIFIGPAYYYFAAFFYWLFDLDPIAAGFIAGITSILTFLTLFFVGKKLFSLTVAILSSFIYAVSFSAIQADRVQWPVNFMPAISLLIFYLLYKVITGTPRYLMFLGLALGFSFHVHVTSIFYVLLILLFLPLFPRKKETLRYALIASLLFLVWLIPFGVVQVRGQTSAINLADFLQNNYHGIHLRRILQLAPDSLIEMESVFMSRSFKIINFLILPLFFLVYCFRGFYKEKILLCSLFFFWFLVPLLVLSVYRGEISNYYFWSTKLHVYLIAGYLLARFFAVKKTIPKAAVILFLIIFVTINLKNFFAFKEKNNLRYYKNKVMDDLKHSRENEFTYGSAESYLYYFYKRKLYGMEK